MQVTLNMTGPELVLLYLAYGNPEAGAIIRQSCQDERNFNAATKPKKERASRRQAERGGE